MAIGRQTSRGGGVIDEADVRGAGDMEWSNLVGINPDHPLVGGSTAASPLPYNIVSESSRIVTTPAGQAGAATAGGLAATPDAFTGSLKHLDDWRDLFNFKGSPMPWLLLLCVGVVLFAHASIQARAGAFGKKAAATAAFG
jgi:hypothetical protein